MRQALPAYGVGNGRSWAWFLFTVGCRMDASDWATYGRMPLEQRRAEIKRLSLELARERRSGRDGNRQLRQLGRLEQIDIDSG